MSPFDWVLDVGSVGGMSLYPAELYTMRIPKLDAVNQDIYSYLSDFISNYWHLLHMPDSKNFQSHSL